ncbi:energy-coupling factor ABC transporter ATP-binding protein [Candidatus Bathyarchaeota archaeon]|nr:energy-coupling factor ABC transporter ATP-binding protein [Candidatus Bathyarchaeota archaeon]
MSEIVKVNCIKHQYPDTTEVQICGLSMTIYSGERVAVLGPNGSGKTTMLLHIVGILRPTEGEVLVFGEPPSKTSLHGKVAMVFQNVDEQIIGPTVWDDIAFSPINYGHSPEEVKKMVNNILEEMNLKHLQNKVPHYLSGGEKKKVAIAGAVVTHPKLLILDEALTGLDPKAKMETIAFLNKLNKEKGMALIITTHEVDILPLIADTVYVIAERNIIYKGTPLDLFQHPEIFEKANLHPPPVITILNKLKLEGVPVEIKKTIEETEEELLKVFLRKKSEAKQN